MTDLTALLERVKAATGGDRELDCLLWAEFDGRDVRYLNNMLLAKHRKPPHDECRLGFIDPGQHSRNFQIETGHKPPVPAYSAYIDSALALVEKKLPGWIHETSGGGGSAPFCRLAKPRHDEIRFVAATQPLAILGALLSALIAQDKAA